MPKTIALAVEHFARHRGGAEGYGIDLAVSLLKAGWEVHLIGYTWDGFPEGCVFHQLFPRLGRPGWLQLLDFAKAHARLVRKNNFDVVLGFGNTTAMNVYQSHGGVHAVSTEAKVWVERSPNVRAVKRFLIRLSPKHRVRQWIESAPFRTSPRPVIVAIAEMIRRDMAAHFPIQEEEIRLVWNGIDPGRFGRDKLKPYQGRVREKYQIGSEETVFLFMSFDLKKKGLGVLIEAAQELKKNHQAPFKVLVVGAKPSRYFITKVSASTLFQHFIFTGPTQNPEEFYADSDAFLLPTFYDACSLVVLEAMAAGLPVLTTSANGAAGLIENDFGFVINHPPQAAELAARMADLLDPDRRAKMGQAAEKAAAGHTMAQTHAQLLEIFEEVVAGKN